MATAQIAAIDPTNLRDSAYRSLHDAFTRGAFAPGDILSLRSLAEQLGTSMTPVREAVRRLVAEGALIDTRSRKLLVPAFDARRMKDLKSARLALESLILDQAMANIDAAGIDTLKAILEPGGSGSSVASAYASLPLPGRLHSRLNMTSRSRWNYFHHHQKKKPSRLLS